MIERITETMARQGVSRWGICSFGALPPLIDCRAKARLPQPARSVLVCLFPYYLGEFPRRNVGHYAVPDDYHRVAGGILGAVAEDLAGHFPDGQFVPFIDNSPLPEVAAARLAGLGPIGRHGQLIDQVYGARVFIGAVVSSLELPPSRPVREGCPGCGACVDACPTGALHRDKHLDKALCRSFITQKKGTLTPWEEEQIRTGGMVWGCDLCLDACPLCGDRPESPLAAFRQNPAPWLEPGNLAALHPQKPYVFRPLPVLERNLRLIYSQQE